MAQSNVEIKNLPPMRLAALEHRGAFSEIGTTFEKLAGLFGERNLWPHSRGSAAVYYDDPSKVPEEKLRSAAGIAVAEDFMLPEDMKEVRTGGTRCAVLRHKGPYSGLPAAWQGLYSDWLPNSGETPSGIPFEVYHNNPADTPAEELLTDICIPLKED